MGSAVRLTAAIECSASSRRKGVSGGSTYLPLSSQIKLERRRDTATRLVQARGPADARLDGCQV